MFASRNERDATRAILQKLGDGAPFAVVPTAIFDERGILIDWVDVNQQPRSTTKSGKKAPHANRFDRGEVRHKQKEDAKRAPQVRIKRKKYDEVNLLSLLAAWEDDARKANSRERVCIETTGGRQVCLDVKAFRAWVRRRAWQEAEVRADTYETSHKDFLVGPFFAQAFIRADDGVQFDVDYSRGGASRLSDEIQIKFRARLRSSTYSMSSESLSKSDSKLDDDILDSVSPIVEPGLQTALRNLVEDLIHYLESRHDICVHVLSLHFIRDVTHGHLVLLHASTAVWGPAENYSRESKEEKSGGKHISNSKADKKQASSLSSPTSPHGTLDQSIKDNSKKQAIEKAPLGMRPGMTKLAEAHARIECLHQTVENLQQNKKQDALRLAQSDKLVSSLREQLEKLRVERDLKEINLRANITEQDRELVEVKDELAEVRAHLALERSLRSQAEQELYDAKQILTSLQTHETFLQKGNSNP